MWDLVAFLLPLMSPDVSENCAFVDSSLIVNLFFASYLLINFGTSLNSAYFEEVFLFVGFIKFSSSGVNPGDFSYT